MSSQSKNEPRCRYHPDKEERLPEFPRVYECDVVIIGAGPNGLITAAYLARAGLDVAVLEERFEMGGGLATEETLFPGYLTNTHAVYHMMVDYMPPIRDFDLDERNLTWIKPNKQTGMVFDDGSSLLMTRMLQDAKDSVGKLSLDAADNFEKTIRRWRRMVEDILAPATYWPPLGPVDFAMGLEQTELGQEMHEMSEMSPYEVIEKNFNHDKLKALMTYVSCMWGLDPRESGTGFMVPLLAVRSMQKYVCYGGSHRFASALGREVLTSGGLILENCEVTDILMEDGQATGVQTRDGRTINADVVASSLPPTSTFLDMVGEEHLSDDFASNIEEWDWDKWSFFTTHAVLEDEPTFEADDPWVDEAFMNIVGFNGTEDVLDFFDAIQSGTIPHVAGHTTCETIYDDTLSRFPDREVAFFQLPAPYDFDWDNRQDEIERRVLERWSTSVTNFNPIKTTSESPRHIETRLASRIEGSFKHGDYTPMQMGNFRPDDRCSSSRTPVDGLYLCGASLYPGGLIIGGPGYIAANVLADDLGVDPWWDVPDYVEDYVETYCEVEP
jgi:phytoene dehydrogenase-like protein